MAWIQGERPGGSQQPIDGCRKLISVDLRGSQNFLGESALSLERIANRFFEGTVSVVVQKSWWNGLHRFFIAVLVLSLGATSLPPIALAATPSIAEASTPPVIQALRRKLERYQPQVQILAPKAGETLQETSVALKFQVKDLPIYKDAKLGLGPHLHVFLDEDNYQAVYDLSQPLVLKDLKPGTHTVRVFASRPWHESFKNDGAFTQVSFNVFTATQDDRPNPDLPLLTYSRPQGSYGAEPIMLDYYLTNAPLHIVADDDKTVRDWRVKATIDGSSFILDKWQPIYLKGFKPGQNWAQLEFIDAKGQAIPNVFNNTVKLFDYQPGGSDALAKLVRGELSEAEAMGIVDPNYVPPVAQPVEAKPPVNPTGEGKPAVKPEVKPEVKPGVKPAAKSGAIPIVPIPAPVAKPAAPLKLGQPAAAPKVEPKKVETKPVEAPIEKTNSPFDGFLNRFKGNNAPAETAKPGISKPAAAAGAAGAAAAAKLIVPKIMPAPATTAKPTAIKAPDIKPEAKPEIKAVVKPEVKSPVVKAAPVKIPVVKPEVKPTVTATPKVEAKPVARKVEAKKAEVKVAPKVEPKKVEPKKVELKVEPKGEPMKVEPKKIDVKVEPKKIDVKVEPKKVEAPIAKSTSPFDGFLNRFKSKDVTPKITPTSTVTPKPAAKPEIKAPAVKTPVMKTPVVKPEVKATAPTVVKPVVKTPAPAVKPTAIPAQPVAPKTADNNYSPFGGFLNRFKSAETAKPAVQMPAVKAPEKPAVKIPAIKAPEKPAVKIPVVKPAAPTVAKPTAPQQTIVNPMIAKPPIAKPTAKAVPTQPSSNFFDRFKAAPKTPATPQNATVPTNRVPTKPVETPKPAATVNPAIAPKAIIKPVTPTAVKPPAKPAVKVVAPKPTSPIVKPVAKPVAPAVTPQPIEPKPAAKPVEAKPESDKFDYLKKYLDKPATAKSIVTKPAAQPIPGKAAKPQPANAIVPKSTTRRENPSLKPETTPINAQPPVRANGSQPQPASPKPQPASSKPTPLTTTINPAKPQTPDSDQFLLNELELPKDVRKLFDRLPMPKEKSDELIPIGKILAK